LTVFKIDNIEINESYHPLDLERINKDTKWIRAFYKHSLENSERTVGMIDEVLTWRKKFNANGLKYLLI
jgi:hypothetical protein